MTPLIFWYSPDQEDDHVATTSDEIDAALDHVANLAPNVSTVAEITRQDVETDGLYAGFNGNVGTLHYVGNGTGTYSQGTTIADADALSYDHQWNVMQFSPDAEIPIADVRAAVHEYFRTGTRPTGVQWQDWTPPRESDNA
ncbi:Imm1 family immunity protein [Actinokineospora sp. 24-640]